MFFYAAENIEHFVKYKQVFQPCLPLIYPKKQRPFIIRSKPDKQANKRQKLEKLKKKKKRDQEVSREFEDFSGKASISHSIKDKTTKLLTPNSPTVPPLSFSHLHFRP